MGSRHRPPPLWISKESQRIRKPPLPLPIVQHRRPIIIHTYSPKIIQTDPNSFMSLVQKLTGRCIEGRSDVQAEGPLLMDSVSLLNPVSYASTVRQAEGIKVYQSNVRNMLSPKNHFLKAELDIDKVFSLTPGPLSVRSPAAFTALASPRLWSPIPSPHIMFQQLFAELPSLSPEIQGRPADHLLSPFPVFSPRNKFGDVFLSPGTIAYADLACKLIGDD